MVPNRTSLLILQSFARCFIHAMKSRDARSSWYLSAERLTHHICWPTAIRCVEISSSCNVLFLVRVETMQWMHCSINPSWCLEEPISACPAMRVLHVAVPFLCLSSGAATCLDDAIPPSERKNLTNVEGLAWLCWGPTQSHDTTSWDSPRETLTVWPRLTRAATDPFSKMHWNLFPDLTGEGLYSREILPVESFFFAMLVFRFWGWDWTNLALGTHGVTCWFLC
jgi:hypothetical protein